MVAPRHRRFWYDPKGNRSGIGSNTNPCGVSTRVLRTNVAMLRTLKRRPPAKLRARTADEMTGQTRWKRRVCSRGESHSRRAAFAVALAAVLLSACQASEKNGPAGSDAASLPPFKPVASVHQLMHDVVYPNADIVWGSVGTIISYEGTEEIYPRNDEEWEAVERSALTLTEAGNLLMIEGRAKDTGAWMERARALIDAAAVALEAARNKDAAAVFDSGEGIYYACEGCHEQYRYDDSTTMR